MTCFGDLLWWCLFGEKLSSKGFIVKFFFCWALVGLKLGIFCGLKLISWVLLRTKVNFLGVFCAKVNFLGAPAFVTVFALSFNSIIKLMCGPLLWVLYVI